MLESFVLIKLRCVLSFLLNNNSAGETPVVE